MGKIKVLVVDDSAFMRKVISDMLNSQSDIEVVATAKNGREALEKINQHEIDVVTMDIEMPLMDGLTALQNIMKDKPTPVIMISAKTQVGATETMKALKYGAVDFLGKPDGSISLKLQESKDEIVIKVRAAIHANLKSRDYVEISTQGAYTIQKPIKTNKLSSKKIVVIGASTGGPPALEEVITKLPEGLPAPVLVVQHMPAGFTKSFADRLNGISAIEVREAKDGDIVQEGLALIAPGDYHMELVNMQCGTEYMQMVRLNQKPQQLGVRPNINIMMNSVPEIYGANIIGVVLTGMGHDGTEGMKKIKEYGGTTIAQDKSTSMIFSMPGSVIEANSADYVLPIDKIAKKIVDCL